jgi:hypothetical protein
MKLEFINKVVVKITVPAKVPVAAVGVWRSVQGETI